MKWPGILQKKFREALQDAFQRGDFERLLKEDLNTSTDNIKAGKNDSDFFGNTIEYFQQRGNIQSLINLVVEERPNNKQIEDFKDIYRVYNIACNTETEQLKSCYQQVLQLYDTFTDRPEKQELHDTDRCQFLHQLFKNLLDTTNYMKKIADFERMLNSYDGSGNPTQKPKRRHFYLLIVVQEIGNKFILHCERIEYCSNGEQIRDRIELNEKDQIESTWEQLPRNIYVLISEITKNKGYKYYERSQYCTLTIELFLPEKYLGEDWDLKITDFDNNNEKVCKSHPLICRSYELNLDLASADEKQENTTQRNYFLERWDIQSKIKQTNYHKHLQTIYSLDSVDTVDNLAISWHIQKIIGLKLFCPLPEQAEIKKALFQNISKASVLFAVWSRQDLPAGNLGALINKLVSWKCVKNFNVLYQNVVAKRYEAHTHNAHNHIGYHLGILCENPERLPNFFKSNTSKKSKLGL